MELGSFDFNLLVALDALLAEQSVSRAAERVRVGQPAMSSTLGRLRALFDDPILVRDGRGSRMTPFAESLREPLAQILAETHALINVGTAFDPLTSHRSFTLIASDYVALVLLRPLIERLSSIAPNVQIRMRPVEAGLLTDLGRGLADLAIYPKELLPTNVPFVSEHLFADEFVCVVDGNNPDVGEEITLDQLSSMPYLAAHQGMMPSWADARLDQLGVPRNTTMAVQSFVMAPFLLPGTKLITLVQRRLTERIMADGNFKILAPPVEIASIHELMLWSPRQTSDAGHVWLRAQMRDLADSL